MEKAPQKNRRRSVGGSAKTSLGCLALVFFVFQNALAEVAVDPEIAQMLERAVQQTEAFRTELQTAEYEAKMRVQEWDGRGRWRGTAQAHAIMRPGDSNAVTFLSREIEGKVRLPKEEKNAKDEKEEKLSLQDFAREHRIAERFKFGAGDWEQVAGQRARRISFKPKPNQPTKDTADRFLNVITGTAWVSEEQSKLVKFELRLLRPFQLLWIFAVLQDLSIQYELITPGPILGHAKLKVLFALTTPVYSIRQLHEVDLDKFRRRGDGAPSRRGEVLPPAAEAGSFAEARLSSTSRNRFAELRGQTAYETNPQNRTIAR